MNACEERIQNHLRLKAHKEEVIKRAIMTLITVRPRSVVSASRFAKKANVELADWVMAQRSLMNGYQARGIHHLGEILRGELGISLVLKKPSRKASGTKVYLGVKDNVTGTMQILWNDKGIKDYVRPILDKATITL